MKEVGFLTAHKRFRVIVWLDEAFDPLQAAIATFVGDDKLTETTWSVGPFDLADDIFDAARQRVAIQRRLW